MRPRGILGGRVTFGGLAPTASTGWGRGGVWETRRGQAALGCTPSLALWTMDLSGDFGKLPASLCLGFPIICEMERWDVTHGFQISSSKTLSFKQNPAVLVLPQQKWEAGPAANESPALRGALPHPHHSGPPLQGPWGTRGLFGTHSGLWCQSPSPSSIS